VDECKPLVIGTDAAHHHRDRRGSEPAGVGRLHAAHARRQGRVVQVETAGNQGLKPCHDEPLSKLLLNFNFRSYTKAGNVDGIACLVELGAHADYESPSHKTALVAAVLAGTIPSIAALCAVGADLDYETVGQCRFDK